MFKTGWQHSDRPSYSGSTVIVVNFGLFVFNKVLMVQTSRGDGENAAEDMDCQFVFSRAVT